MIDPLVDYQALKQRPKTNGQQKPATRPLIRASDLRDLAGPVERWIVNNPTAALATAFVTGVVLAWLVKRK